MALFVKLNLICIVQIHKMHFTWMEEPIYFLLFLFPSFHLPFFCLLFLSISFFLSFFCLSLFLSFITDWNSSKKSFTCQPASSLHSCYICLTSETGTISCETFFLIYTFVFIYPKSQPDCNFGFYVLIHRRCLSIAS